LGIKRENIKRPTDRKIFQVSNCPHWQLAQTSLIVPTKKVKIKVPTRMPKPIPPEVIPETHLGQAHAEVHGCEREIDQAQAFRASVGA
jgi:hypothetical protein